MSTETLRHMKTELCSQIEDIIGLLNSAGQSAELGDFNVSADILKNAIDKVTAAEVAARNSSPDSGLTPWEHFRQPILEVLVQEGGSARNWQVFEYLEEHMDLTESDIEPHVADSRETMWQHTCRVAAKKMRDGSLGYLKPTTVQGVWTITAAGRRSLENLDNAVT